jgi:hypothetical protein
MPTTVENIKAGKKGYHDPNKSSSSRIKTYSVKAPEGTFDKNESASARKKRFSDPQGWKELPSTSQKPEQTTQTTAKPKQVSSFDEQFRTDKTPTRQQLTRPPSRPPNRFLSPSGTKTPETATPGGMSRSSSETKQVSSFDEQFRTDKTPTRQQLTRPPSRPPNRFLSPSGTKTPETATPGGMSRSRTTSPGGMNKSSEFARNVRERPQQMGIMPPSPRPPKTKPEQTTQTTEYPSRLEGFLSQAGPGPGRPGYVTSERFLFESGQPAYAVDINLPNLEGRKLIKQRLKENTPAGYDYVETQLDSDPDMERIYYPKSEFPQGLSSADLTRETVPTQRGGTKQESKLTFQTKSEDVESAPPSWSWSGESPKTPDAKKPFQPSSFTEASLSSWKSRPVGPISGVEKPVSLSERYSQLFSGSDLASYNVTPRETAWLYGEIGKPSAIQRLERTDDGNIKAYPKPKSRNRKKEDPTSPIGVWSGRGSKLIRGQAEGLLSSAKPQTLAGKGLKGYAEMQKGIDETIREFRETKVGGSGLIKGAQETGIQATADIAGGLAGFYRALALPTITAAGGAIVAEQKLTGKKGSLGEAAAFGSALGYGVSGFSELPRTTSTVAAGAMAGTKNAIISGAVPPAFVASGKALTRATPMTYRETQTLFESGILSGPLSQGATTATGRGLDFLASKGKFVLKEGGSIITTSAVGGAVGGTASMGLSLASMGYKPTETELAVGAVFGSLAGAVAGGVSYGFGKGGYIPKISYGEVKYTVAKARPTPKGTPTYGGKVGRIAAGQADDIITQYKGTTGLAPSKTSFGVGAVASSTDDIAGSMVRSQALPRTAMYQPLDTRTQTYRGVYFQWFNKAKPLIGMSEGKLQIGTPKFGTEGLRVYPRMFTPFETATIQPNLKRYISTKESQIATYGKLKEPAEEAVLRQTISIFSSKAPKSDQMRAYIDAGELGGTFTRSRVQLESLPAIMKYGYKLPIRSQRMSLEDVMAGSDVFGGKKGAKTVLSALQKQDQPFIITGSTPQQSQMGKYMTRQAGDVDLWVAGSAEDFAQSMLTEIKTTYGKNVRISPDKPSLIEFKLRGKGWVHGLDIHSDVGDDIASSSDNLNPDYIMGTPRPEPIISKEGFRIQSLQEQILAKGESALIPQQFGVGPAAHRIKDVYDPYNIGRFYMSTETVPDEVVGSISQYGSTIPRSVMQDFGGDVLVIPSSSYWAGKSAPSMTGLASRTMTKSIKLKTSPSLEVSPQLDAASSGSLAIRGSPQPSPKVKGSPLQSPVTSKSLSSASLSSSKSLSLSPSPSISPSLSPSPSISPSLSPSPSISPSLSPSPSISPSLSPSPSISPSLSPSRSLSLSPSISPSLSPSQSPSPLISSPVPPRISPPLPPKIQKSAGGFGFNRRKRTSKAMNFWMKGKPRSMLSDIFSVAKSQRLFGKATHPSFRKRGPSLWGKVKSISGKLATVELLDKKKKRKKEKPKGLKNIKATFSNKWWEG